MLLDNLVSVLKQFAQARREGSRPLNAEQQPVAALKSIGFDDFLAIDVPPREMLLGPILPERSLAMLYAPRGIGKTLLSLSIGLAVASGTIDVPVGDSGFLRFFRDFRLGLGCCSHERYQRIAYRLLHRVGGRSVEYHPIDDCLDADTATDELPYRVGHVLVISPKSVNPAHHQRVSLP